MVRRVRVPWHDLLFGDSKFAIHILDVVFVADLFHEPVSKGICVVPIVGHFVPIRQHASTIKVFFDAVAMRQIDELEQTFDPFRRPLLLEGLGVLVVVVVRSASQILHEIRKERERKLVVGPSRRTDGLRDLNRGDIFRQRFVESVADERVVSERWNFVEERRCDLVA